MDKKQFEKLGIIAFILFMLLAIVWGTYKLVKGRKKKEPEKGPPRTLKPLKSAKVEAVKTGATGSGVSGYSFKREYAEGDECTFTSAMNKYVTLNVTLTIEQEEYLAYIDGVRATWKIGNTILSTNLMSFSPPTSVLGTSLQIPIPTYTDTIINIACNGVSPRTDNTILIEYSSNLTPDYTPWGTIRMEQGLGTEITSAFSSIPVGKATDLVITLVDATVSGVTQSQDIPYKFTAKSGGVITDINLETGSSPNEYIMKYKGTTLNIKTYKIEGIATYTNYVAAKVMGGPNDGKFIYFSGINKDLSYRADYDDSCFFKIELDSRDCVYSAWSDSDGGTTGPTGDCPTSCGYGGGPLQRRTFTPAVGGGSCPNSRDALERTCSSTDVCPVDCVQTAWRDETTCSKTCGSGTKSQSRTTTTPAVGSGTACGPLTQDNVPCNTQACTNDDCVWQNYIVYGTTCSVTACNSMGYYTDTESGVRPDGVECKDYTYRSCNTPPCTIWDSTRENQDIYTLVSSPTDFWVRFDSGQISFYKGVFTPGSGLTTILVSTINTGITGSSYARFRNSRLVITNGTNTVKYPTSDSYVPGATYLKMTSTNLSEPVLTLNRATDDQAIYRWPVRNTLTFPTDVSLIENNPIVNEEGGGSLVLQENGTLTLYDRAGRNIWTLGTPNQTVYEKPYRLGVSGSSLAGTVSISVSGKKKTLTGFHDTTLKILLGAVATPNRIVVERDTRTGAGPNAVCIKIFSSTSSSPITTLPVIPSPL